MPAARPKPPTPEREKRLRAMHGAGATAAEIAAGLCVSDATARAWLRDLGLAANRPEAPAGRAFWTAERREVARALVAREGATPAAAAEVGCTTKALGEKARAEGWPCRDHNAERRAARRERVARAQALAAAGWNAKRIAGELGVGVGQVSDYLRAPAPAGADAAPAPVFVAAASNIRSAGAAREAVRKGTASRRGSDNDAPPPRPGWPRMKECPICRVPRMCARPEDRYHERCRIVARERDTGAQHAVAGRRR